MTTRIVMVGAGRYRNGTTHEVINTSEDPRLAVDREFIEAVREERPATRATYAEALGTHRLACAIAESARRREPVRLGEGAGGPG